MACSGLSCNNLCSAKDSFRRPHCCLSFCFHLLCAVFDPEYIFHKVNSCSHIIYCCVPGVLTVSVVVFFLVGLFCLFFRLYKIG